MSEQMTTALADCAKHHVALPRDQMKRTADSWKCPYCEVERLRLQLRWTRKMGAALLGKPLDLAEIERIEAELERLSDERDQALADMSGQTYRALQVEYRLNRLLKRLESAPKYKRHRNDEGAQTGAMVADDEGRWIRWGSVAAAIAGAKEDGDG